MKRIILNIITEAWVSLPWMILAILVFTFTLGITWHLLAYAFGGFMCGVTVLVLGREFL